MMNVSPYQRLKITLVGIVFVGVVIAALQGELGVQLPARKDKRPSVRDALAAHYVGMSEAELIKELGPPKQMIAAKSPDMERDLIYSDTKWAETEFAVYDGVVSEGQVNGVSFETPGFEAASIRCTDLWPADVDRWLSCVKPYRAKPKSVIQSAR